MYESWKGTYVGTNGSMGYLYGRDYEFTIINGDLAPRAGQGDVRAVPYTLVGFLRNWDNVRRVR